jgi:hypothetical protein
MEHSKGRSLERALRGSRNRRESYGEGRGAFEISARGL